MTRILAIRPEPGLSATITLAAEYGIDVYGAPLFEVRPMDWVAPDPAAIDALLIGSANAILHSGEALAAFKDKPVHAVGATTAAAAREAGFAVETVGTGGLQSVIEGLSGPLRLLRVSGAEHVPLVAPDGVSIQTVIAYESVPLPLGEDMVGALGKPCIVLLHSAAAARHFAQECERLEIDRSAISLAALGPRIVEGLSNEWQSIHISPRPRDTDLLEMVRKLCL